MRFDIVTLFPFLFDSFSREGILARAQKQGHITFGFHNPREAAKNRHKTVDDRPYGGGAGMLLKIEPIVRTLKKIKRKKSSRIILLSPAGKQFTQKKAATFAKKYDQIIFICGRYEGVDARIKHYIDETLSIGPYVLNGGEVAAMAVMEAVFRLVPGALGNPESLKEESFTKMAKKGSGTERGQAQILGTGSGTDFAVAKTEPDPKLSQTPTEPDPFFEYPQYTRPEVFDGHRVPKVLLSGDHKKIVEWRAKKRRPLPPSCG